MIIYNSGDGNDTITYDFDFNSTSTLQIGDGTGSYSTQTSGNDFLVKVDKGTIRFKDVCSIADAIININGNSITPTVKAIKLTEGNDKIEITKDSLEVNTYGGNDSIYNGDQSWWRNGGKKVTIKSGAGDDLIYNYVTASLTAIDASTGNDSIVNLSDSVTINGGAGNDSIQNGGVWEYSPLEGKNGGDNITINGGSGNDFIYSYGGDSISIAGGDGDDIIHNERNYSYGSGDFITISGGKGNDSIKNSGFDAIIDGGTGNDYIQGGSSIDAGAGNDTIEGGGTIAGGKGKDFISLHSDGINRVIKYKSGDGNDTIYGFNSTDTLSISGGSYSTQASGRDVLVKVGKGSIRLKNAYVTADALHINKKSISLEHKIIRLTDSENIDISRDSLSVVGSSGNDTIYNGRYYFDGLSDDKGCYNSINGGDGDDSIYNNGSNVLIDGGDGNDSIKTGYGYMGHVGNLTLNGGNGNDYILNDNSRKSTINGGSGNDSILNNYSDSVSIDAGTGDDYIFNDAWYVSINAGAGDDTISIVSARDNVIKYSAGDGNDIIYGFNSTSTLDSAASFYSTKKSGDNVVVTVGKGKITLVGAADLEILNIEKDTSGGSSSDPTTTKTVTNSTKSPVTVGSAIKTIDASSRTKAVKITGNSLANTITGGSGKDTIYGGAGDDSIVGGKGNDKLYGQTGNDKLRGGRGNDSLWGGAGNDSLWGGDGNDTFIFRAGEGTDKIFDYSSGDMLKILKSNGKTGSFSKSKYSGGTLSLTISGGGQILFDDVSRSETFNINNTSYKISGSKLVKK